MYAWWDVADVVWMVLFVDGKGSSELCVAEESVLSAPPSRLPLSFELPVLG